MAANLMGIYPKLLACALAGCLCLPLLADAAEMQDPTRPPAGLGDAQLAPGASEPASRGLQSVIISKARCAAILDGRTVLLGGRYGAERLVEVNQHGVVLQGGSGMRTLNLFPAVSVKTSAGNTPGKAQARCGLEPRTIKEDPAEAAGEKEKK